MSHRRAIGPGPVANADVQAAGSRLWLFVERHRKALRRMAADLHRHLVATVPNKINTVQTENGGEKVCHGSGGMSPLRAAQ